MPASRILRKSVPAVCTLPDSPTAVNHCDILHRLIVFYCCGDATRHICCQGLDHVEKLGCAKKILNDTFFFSASQSLNLPPGGAGRDKPRPALSSSTSSDGDKPGNERKRRRASGKVGKAVKEGEGNVLREDSGVEPEAGVESISVLGLDGGEDMLLRFSKLSAAEYLFIRTSD